MGRFVEGSDRSQMTLFPECLDDWIDEDNPVRVIDIAFVDAMDLGVGSGSTVSCPRRRAGCQSAGNGDPGSACERDPCAGEGRSGRASGAVRWSGGFAREAALGVGLDQARFLKRQLSLPVSTMSQWWVSRSSRAVVILASPKTLGHSPKARLVVTITELRS